MKVATRAASANGPSKRRLGPKGVTFCTLVSPDGLTLGVKTDEGADCAPLGPWVVSADQIEDPNTLAIQTWVNGEVRQDLNTSDMIYDCRTIVSYCSRHLTLKPGELELTLV